LADGGIAPDIVVALDGQRRNLEDFHGVELGVALVLADLTAHPGIARRPCRGVRFFETAELVEAEPSDSPAKAQLIPVPGSVNGRLAKANEADLFAFEAKRGQQLVLETLAARAGSPADTKIEMRLVHIFEMRDGRIARELVFDMGGPPVEGAIQQAGAAGGALRRRRAGAIHR
jgi:hypothetical protein